jgi:hypothetical protein
MVAAPASFGVTRMVSLASVTPLNVSTMPGILAIWAVIPSAISISSS